MKRSLGQSTTSAGGGPPSEAEAEAVPLSKREWLLERFPLLSYLIFPILCIPPCYWPFSWPRLRRKKVEGHRVHRRDYLDYEECTLEKRLNKAAARQFIIDNDLSGFADVRYLPEVKNDVVRLIYLTTITSVADGRLPYTHRLKDIFKISAKADFWTVLCLNLAMVFVPLFGLVALFSALAFIDALSAKEAVLVPAALAAFFTSVAGLLSLIATGSNPHFASVAANEKQNALVELENDFASLAIDLLKMYYSQDRASQDFARRIARGLKVGVLRDLLAKQTEWNLTEPLREAKRFILHKNVCFHSTTIRCYLTGEHRHEIKRRKALSKAENYFKKLNIPTLEDDCLSSDGGMADMGSDTDTEWEGDMAALDSTPPPPPVPRATGVEPVGDELV